MTAKDGPPGGWVPPGFSFGSHQEASTVPWIIVGAAVIAACLIWLAYELKYPYEDEAYREPREEDTAEFDTRSVA